MFNVGIDFDNTLVNYDRSFYDLAYEKDLIPLGLEKSKNAVRKFLRDKGKDEYFSLLQGEIYGPKILKAKPAKGCIKAIQSMQKSGFNIFIVSHKIPQENYQCHKVKKSTSLQERTHLPQRHRLHKPSKH